MKILVIGDYISDVYTFGTATRLCPEAPVPVVVPEKFDLRNGGAGLVLEQLSALGAEVLSRYGSYSEKHRYFIGNHLVCRIDVDNQEWPPYRNFKDAPIEPSLDWADAFVVSDYGKGAMTRELAAHIVGTGKPCFVDAKHHWQWYEGNNSTAFPNEHEDAPTFPKVAKKLGAQGARLIENYKQFSEPMLEIRATVSEVVDTTGAGDIFMASFVYAWSIQLPAEDCLRFANELAGESCRHRGTYVVPREFAQSIVGKLRYARSPEMQRLARLSGSNEFVPQQTSAQDRMIWPEGSSGATGACIPQIYSSMAEAEWEEHRQILRPAQTPPRSPLVPIGSSDTPTPVDQAIQDGANSAQQSVEKTQSSTESARQCERILGPDQDLLGQKL